LSFFASYSEAEITKAMAFTPPEDWVFFMLSPDFSKASRKVLINFNMYESRYVLFFFAVLNPKDTAKRNYAVLFLSTSIKSLRSASIDAIIQFNDKTDFAMLVAHLFSDDVHGKDNIASQLAHAMILIDSKKSAILLEHWLDKVGHRFPEITRENVKRQLNGLRKEKGTP
jgi:hypothetical protein